MNSYNLTEDQENTQIQSIISAYFPVNGTPELAIVRSPIFSMGGFNTLNFYNPYGKYISTKEQSYMVYTRTFVVTSTDLTIKCCITLTYTPAKNSITSIILY